MLKNCDAPHPVVASSGSSRPLNALVALVVLLLMLTSPLLTFLSFSSYSISGTSHTLSFLFFFFFYFSSLFISSTTTYHRLRCASTKTHTIRPSERAGQAKVARRSLSIASYAGARAARTDDVDCASGVCVWHPCDARARDQGMVR